MIKKRRAAARLPRHPAHPFAVATLTLLQVSTMIAITQLLSDRPRAFLYWGLCSLLYAAAAPRISRRCYGGQDAVRFSRPALLLIAAVTLAQGLINFGFYAKFTLTAILRQTPALAMILSAGLAVWAVLRRGETALKRLCRLLLPVCLVLLLAVYLLQVEQHRVLETLAAIARTPLDRGDLRAFLTVLLFCFCRPVLLTPILFPEMDSESFATAQRRAVLIFGPLMTLQILMPVLTLGLPLYMASPYPFYDAINLLVHGSPVMRMDTLAGFALILAALIDLGATALVVRRAWKQLRAPNPQAQAEG